VRVKQDEDLQTRTGRGKGERETEAAIVKEDGIVCYSMMENKKKTPSLARRNYLLLFFYWMACSFSRSLVDEPGRENKKKKQASNDEVRRE
jgi:hypothetical protein